MSRRNVINYLVLTIMLIAFVELSGYALIYLSEPLFSEPIRKTSDIYAEQSAHIRRWLQADGRGRDIVDADLGWRYRAGFTGDRNRINEQGLRSERVYATLPSTGTIRVAAFGDSFVYGNEVIDAHAWASVVDTTFDDIDVLNYGVGGYGVDQALLRFRLEGSDLSPHVVLIGFIADDIRRVVNVYQRFASTHAGIFTKPRFELEPDGSLGLLPAPIQALEDWADVLDTPSIVTGWGEHDQWYEPAIYENPLYDLSASVRLLSSLWTRLDNRYLDSDRLFIGQDFNTASTGYRLQIAIFEQFVRDVETSGAYPIVLILPSRGELESALAGERIIYTPLLDDLTDLGIEYWEAADAFRTADRSAGMDTWFESGGHYSPTGNRIVATWLGPRLRELKEKLPGQLAN